MDVLGGYRLTEQLLDTAGFTLCRAVRVDDDGEAVVLKVLNPAYPTPERIAWFSREFEILRGIDRPQVVRALSLESDEYRWFMVLADFPGEPLVRALQRRPLGVTETLRLALGLIDALGQVHESSVVHKDINPSSIIWDEPTSSVTLVNFGSASVFQRQNATVGNPDTLEGTLAYIAPEQTGRMNRAIDYRSDFYSLGVTLYELLAGSLPFESSDSMELVHCHLARQPQPVCDRNPDVPQPISDVVMKLMAKTAEARYQSTFGIRADVEVCLRQLESGGRLERFELGRDDVCERFQIPQKLYGREQELELLLSAFARATSDTARRSQMILVTGQSGIGKSVLVRELYTPITERRGYFVSGKFDQLQRTTPYSAIVSAFRSLVRQLLTEDADSLQRWREALQDGLGGNGGVLVQVIPEVQLIVGPQPSVQPLGPTESENRFNLVFQHFVRTLAQPGHPVTLFLDDLQWADSASLNLCRLIMQDERLSLLLIGAYRDNEVGPGHLLTVSLEKLREDGAEIHAVHLGPLSLEHVTELIADTTASDRATCLPLARLVVEKTGGNPFFANFFLTTAYQDRLIGFERRQGRWQWDIAEVAARGYTDNVVSMAVDRLRRLPQSAQVLLQLAASLGNSFDLEPLASIYGQPPRDTAAELRPAVEAGFVLTTSTEEVIGEAGPLLVGSYRFVHDRVQQAAYALIGEAERKALHLRIGRRMLKAAADAGTVVDHFGVVGHLNVARELIENDEERTGLATLNLEAARRAKAATAYAAAREYLLAALGLLHSTCWDDQYALTLAAHQELIDAEYLGGHHAEAERLANETLARELRDIDKAETYIRLVEIYTLQARYPEALEAARRGLRLVGDDLPLDNVEAAMGAAFGDVKARMVGRELSSLLDDPEITDPEALVATKLFKVASAPAFYAGPLVYSLVTFKSVSLFLRFGASSEACNMYAAYGMIVSSIERDIHAGDALGKLALDLSERFRRLDNVCLSTFLWSGFVRHWSTHLPVVIESLEKGYRAGVESGELRFAGYTLVYVLLDKFSMGRSLGDLTSELDEYLSFSEKTKNQLSVDCFTGAALVFDNLKGHQPDWHVFGTTALSEASFLETCTRNQSWMAMCYYHICKELALYLYREPRAALDASAAASQHLANIMGNYAESAHNLYTSLALAASLESADVDQRAGFLGRLQANQQQLKVWADACPENFLHQYLLVEAECARVAGNVTEAMPLYDKAIALARQHRFAFHEALANELAGRLKMHEGREASGRESLSAAHYGYRLWGARHKVALLEQEYPWLASGGSRALAADSTVPRGWNPSQTGPISLDLASVIKASQAISGEIVLDKLLRQLMRLVIENAGARRGVLVVETDGALRVEASAAVATVGEREELEIEVGQSTPLEQYDGIPRSVVAYAARTADSVILHDAQGEGNFTRDPYIVNTRPRSVLCAPLSSHGRVVGYLYIDNNLVAGAFTPERLEVLRLLSSQFVISFDNARLYDEMDRKIQRRTEELSQKNQALEHALGELRSTQAQLVHAEKMASLGQLTAGVAHEINNPLNFVNNFAQLSAQLLEELMEADDQTRSTRVVDVMDTLRDLKSNIDAIDKHGQRATGIVASMLKHARSTTGLRELVDLNGFVAQYVSLATFGARGGDDAAAVAVELQFDDAVGRVELMPQEFGQVLVNLLNNAFDAVRDRGRNEPGFVGGAVTISTHREPGWVEVAVSDNGSGVAPAIRDRIFEPFFTTKAGKGGTGLGLSLCYEIMVHGHGGRLTVDSVLGRRTTFVAGLPVDNPQA